MKFRPIIAAAATALLLSVAGAPMMAQAEDTDDNYYCDLANRPAGVGTAAWLRSAPEGANTDCLNVHQPVVTQCTVDVPMTNLTSTTFNMAWVEGDYEGNLSDTLDLEWNTTFPVVAEPGETLTVTVFMEGAEKDFALAEFSGADDAAWTFWYGDGKAFTLECPAEQTPPPADDDEQDDPKPEDPKQEDPEKEAPKAPEKTKPAEKQPGKLPRTGV